MKNWSLEFEIHNFETLNFKWLKPFQVAIARSGEGKPFTGVIFADKRFFEKFFQADPAYQNFFTSFTVWKPFKQVQLQECYSIAIL